MRFLIALRSEMYALSDRNAIRIRTNFLLEICANNIENQCANHGFAKISNVPYFVHNFIRAESAQISFRNLRKFLIYVLFFLYVSHKFPKGNLCAFWFTNFLKESCAQTTHKLQKISKVFLYCSQISFSSKETLEIFANSWFTHWFSILFAQIS